MRRSDLILTISQFIFLGTALFMGILLWVRHRVLEWMLIILAVVASYLFLIYDLLVRIGIIDELGLQLGSISLLRILLANLPAIFLILAFAAYLAKYRMR